MIRILLTAAMLLLASASGEAPGEEGEGGWLLETIRGLAARDGRPWAKPIEMADMDRIMELAEEGWITLHEAGWYVLKEDDE